MNWQIELKWGLLTGLAISLWVLTEFFLGFHSTRMDLGEISGYFSGLIPLATYALALKEKKNQLTDGGLTFTNGVISGLAITVVTGLVLVVFFALYNTVIHPEYTETGIAWQTAKLKSQGYADSTITRFMTDYRQKIGLGNTLFMVFFGTLAQGALISMVVTPFVIRKRKKG
ncbi:MAG: DUF4199 domain-containing protein [Bacteroidetes bacterium]|nr:DUF4199 domain-containing protein [Bacteroidota bacterium]